jgi:hypothetical protein
MQCRAVGEQRDLDRVRAPWPIRAACRALSTRLPTTVLTEIGSVTEDGTHESSDTRRTMPFSCACSVFGHQQCL